MSFSTVRPLCCIAAALLFSARPAVSGKVYTVPSDGAPTIAAAIAKAQSGDTVMVKKGTYKENIFLNPGVVVKARTLHEAIVDGGGRGVTVTMGNSCVLEGLVVRNGTIGVLSSSANNSIFSCLIVNNMQSGVMAIGHLPAMEDNIIAFNKGSGVQGWDTRSTTSSINHNTIGFNENHGVSLGGNSNIIVENNIIAFNEQFGIKAEADAVVITLIKNDFYENGSPAQSVPADNIAVDPLFADPQRLDFTLGAKSRCKGVGSDQKDLGARLSGLKKK